MGRQNWAVTLHLAGRFPFATANGMVISVDYLWIHRISTDTDRSFAGRQTP